MKDRPILILNGEVIDPANEREGAFDVLIEGGRIKAVEEPGVLRDVADAQQIDAAGLWVLPGFVDLHVHLREPGFEWKETIETGSLAAVAGGFTTICCMANTDPVNDSAEVTKFIRERADAAGMARVHPIGAVSQGLKGEKMAPLSELARGGCVGFSDDGHAVSDAGLMRRALEWCLMLDRPICCHEESRTVCAGGAMNESPLSTRLGLKGMPKAAEDSMIARDIELARATGGWIHICHVSTRRGVELIRRAKQDGVRITAEAAPHHLALTEEAVSSYDANWKMSPPLREEEDVEALLEGAADGTLDAIATDHAPHENDSKQKEFSLAAFGIIGLQTALPIVLDLVEKGRLRRRRAIELLTSGPARAFKLPAGVFLPGAPADLILVDPEAEWILNSESNRSKSSNSPFWERRLKGLVRSTMIGGKFNMQNGEVRVDG